MDPNQIASDKANRSGSTVFKKEKKKKDSIQVQQDNG